MHDFAVRVRTAKAGGTHLFYIGQAGFIIKSGGGQLLAVDPYLSDCVERVEGHTGFKRLLPRILTPYELEFDGVIATHPHFDHFDMDAIPQLMSNQRTRLFASTGCRKEIKRLMMPEGQVCYVEPGDSHTVGDFLISFVSCDHGEGAPDAVGAVVTVDGRNIYFAGDTCLRLDRAEEYKGKGKLDIMAAPINGRYGNLDARECAMLARELEPALTVPCHYGMFASHGGDPGLFLEAMQELCPGQGYLLMCMGEQYTLGEAHGGAEPYRAPRPGNL